MNKIFMLSIKIPSEVSVYCQHCEYELAGYLELMRWLMDSKFGNGGWQETKFDEIKSQYLECRHKKSLIMDRIRDMYIPEEYKKNNYEMIVDFIKQEVRIYENVAT